MRQQQQELTRSRIVEALVELHQEVGPKNTTIAAVAERAGVQRLTVYRHFENESAMVQACSGLWLTRNPPPHEGLWQDLPTADERVRSALLAIHRYFARNEAMLANVHRDATEMAALTPIMDGFNGYFTSLADKLAADLAGDQPGRELQAMTRHFTHFSTWQSLTREKLSEDEIVEIGLKCLKRLAN